MLQNVKTTPFLVLNSLSTNNLLIFTSLFRGKVKDLHFQVIVPRDKVAKNYTSIFIDAEGTIQNVVQRRMVVDLSRIILALVKDPLS